MLMELVLHMAPLANTSEPLLLVLMSRELTLVAHAHVSMEAPLEVVFPHLWARTTSVSQA